MRTCLKARQYNVAFPADLLLHGHRGNQQREALRPRDREVEPRKNGRLGSRGHEDKMGAQTDYDEVTVTVTVHGGEHVTIRLQQLLELVRRV